MLEESFPLTNAFEAQPPAPSDQPSPFPLLAPADFATVFATRIIYAGGGDLGRFENSTPIPAEADGSGGADTLIGGSADDTLFGGSGDDHLFPGVASNLARGGDGNDLIDAYGASGNANDLNRLCGSAGEDTFMGDPLSGDNIAGAFGDLSLGDGDPDQLFGFNNAGSAPIYQFATGQDTIVDDGAAIPEGSPELPQSSPEVDCD